MNPVTITATLAAADDDGIAQSQSPLVAGNLTLNGALVAGGVATLTGAGMVRQVIITSAGNDSGITFTIYGTNDCNSAISEVLTGASTGAAASALYYQTVTRIAVSGATAAAVIAGTNSVGSTRIVNPDFYMAPFAIGIGCVVVGTINYTVQHTFDNILALNAANTSFAWFDNSGLANKTASADGNYAFPVRGIRLKINTGTGSVTINLIQGVTTQ